MKNTKNILFLAYSFPPDSRSGIYRVLYFANYLAKRENYRPFVLTIHEQEYEKGIHKDYLLLDKIQFGVKVYRTNCIQIRESVINTFRREKQNTLNKSETQEIFGKASARSYWQFVKDIFTDEILSFPDPQIGWLPFAVQQGSKVINQQNIDIIFATGSPWTDFIAGCLLKKINKIPLIIDYRDPWNNNPFNNRNKSRLFHQLSRLTENKIVNIADTVILNTESLRDVFIKRYRTYNKFHWLPNGYIRDDDQKNLNIENDKQDLFTFIHAGALYGNRSPINFLKAFKNLLNQGIFNQLKAKVILIGDLEEKIKGELVSLFGGEIDSQHIGISDRISHDECHSEMIRAQCLLLFQQGTKVQVPRKVYDYIALRKPILAVTQRNSETSKIIERTDAGIIVEDKISEISNAILKLYYSYEEYERRLNQNEMHKAYEMSFLTAKLESIFSENLDINK